MRLGLSEEQQLLQRTFADLSAAESTAERVRAAEAQGGGGASLHDAATTVHAGSSEINRSIIAQQALGLPRSRS